MSTGIWNLDTRRSWLASWHHILTKLLRLYSIMPFLYVLSARIITSNFLIGSRHCWWSLHKCYFCVILFFHQPLVVIQDLLRVFVIRIACQNAKYTSMLIQPVLSSIIYHVSESSSQSDTDAYKVRFLSA